MKIIKILIAGFLFIFFAFICLIGNLFFIPIVLFKLQKKPFFKNFSRDLVRFSWKFFLQTTQLLKYNKYTFKKIDNLGQKGELIISNHPSLLDVVILLSNIKRANCVVKDNLRKNIFLCFSIKACDYIFNTQNEELLQNSIDVLKNGESLIIFPEGTRTKENIIFHKAAFYIAIKGANKITPITINMNPKSLKKGQSWYDTPDVLIKYDLEQKKSIKICDFFTEKPDPIRSRLLYKEVIQIYEGII